MRNKLIILCLFFFLFMSTELATAAVDLIHDPAWSTDKPDNYQAGNWSYIKFYSDAAHTQPVVNFNPGTEIYAIAVTPSTGLPASFTWYWRDGSTTERYYLDVQPVGNKNPTGTDYISTYANGAIHYASQDSFTIPSSGQWNLVVQEYIGGIYNSNEVSLVASPNLALTKSASSTTYSKVGDVITYTYKVKNTGNVPITAPITVTDNKLGTVTIPTSNLPVGANATGTKTYTVTSADVTAGSITNTATAHGTYNSAAVNSNTATATVTLNPQPSLNIIKSASPDPYTPYDTSGDKITYTYKVSNTGNVPINGPITISDNKIDNGTPFTIPTSNLPVGANITGTAIYTVTPADITTGSITNSATASGTYNSAPINSNTATLTVYRGSPPTMNVSKEASQETFDKVGDVITYEYRAWNLGGATMPGPITVIDDKIGPITMSSTGPLVPESAITGTANYTITEADVEAGFVTNTVTSTGIYKNTTFSANESVTIYLNPAPTLNLTKTAAPTTYANVGDVITYTYNVNNDGNVPITAPITITDDKINGGTPFTINTSNSNIAAGSSVTGTNTYTITAADLTAGSVTNSATARGTYNSTVVDSNTASATVNYVVPTYDLSIQDTSGTPQTNFGSGDTVNAVFTKHNDTSLTTVTYVWKDPQGNIVYTDQGITLNGDTATVTHNPTISGTWTVDVYPGTTTTGTPLATGTFNVTVSELLAAIPLLFVGAVYTFMRRRKQQ